MFCASANLRFCNVGSKPTFRTRKREVLDLILINQNAENCISDWHVSDVPSFSDHMYIRFRVQSSTCYLHLPPALLCWPTISFIATMWYLHHVTLYVSRVSCCSLVASCCSIWLVFDGVVSGGEGRCSTITMVHYFIFSALSIPSRIG